MITNDIIGSSTADNGARPAKPCGSTRVIPAMSPASRLRAFPRTTTYTVWSQWIETAMQARQVLPGRDRPINIAALRGQLLFRSSF